MTKLKEKLEPYTFKLQYKKGSLNVVTECQCGRRDSTPTRGQLLDEIPKEGDGEWARFSPDSGCLARRRQEFRTITFKELGGERPGPPREKTAPESGDPRHRRRRNEAGVRKFPRSNTL